MNRAQGGLLTGADATGTIFDDDGQPVVSIQDTVAVEGANARFDVVFSNVNSAQVTITYQTRHRNDRRQRLIAVRSADRAASATGCCSR